MSDPLLAKAIIENILTAIDRIERRFAGINKPDDFWLMMMGLTGSMESQ